MCVCEREREREREIFEIARVMIKKFRNLLYLLSDRKYFNLHLKT